MQTHKVNTCSWGFKKTVISHNRPLSTIVNKLYMMCIDMLLIIVCDVPADCLLRDRCTTLKTYSGNLVTEYNKNFLSKSIISFTVYKAEMIENDNQIY